MPIDHLQDALNNYIYSLGNVQTTEVVLPCCGEELQYNENPQKFFEENEFKPHEVEDGIYYCPFCGETVYNNINDEITIIKV
ncbi:MAG: hypothetical protein ACOCWW_01850 [Bacteroidota bacterium]